MTRQIINVDCQRCGAACDLDPATAHVRTAPTIVVFAGQYLGGTRSLSQAWDDSRLAVTALRANRRLEQLTGRVRFCPVCRREVCPSCMSRNDGVCIDCGERPAVGPARRSRRPRRGIGAARRALALEETSVRDVRKLAARHRKSAAQGPVDEESARLAIAQLARIAARESAAASASRVAVVNAAPRFEATARGLAQDVEQRGVEFQVRVQMLIGQLEAAAFPDPSGGRVRVRGTPEAEAGDAATPGRTEVHPYVRAVTAYGVRFARRLVSAGLTVVVVVVALVLLIRLLGGA